MKIIYYIVSIIVFIFITIGIFYLCLMDLKAERSIRTYNPNAIYHMFPIDVQYPNRVLKLSK